MSTQKVSRTIKIINKRGLHARASAALVKCVERFESEICVAKENTCVSGTSIIDLMMLTAHIGSTLRITARGTDAQEALDEISRLIQDKFGEEE